MSRVVWELLAWALPWLVASAFMVGAALFDLKMGMRRSAVNFMAGAFVTAALGLVIWQVILWQNRPSDTPPPVNRLAECHAAHGVQMVLIGDEWKCVPADQAG